MDVESELEFVTIVECVRAGRSFGGPWPNDAPFAVAISFDSDHETPWLNAGDTRPGALSEAEYGFRRGMPRILRLLDDYQVKATFFVPGLAARLHPTDIDSVLEHGHEVGLHGWKHERTSDLGLGEEEDLLNRSIDLFRKEFGIKPQGMRTPSLDTSANTLPLALAAGLLYDSSLMSDDDPYELVIKGKPTGLIEVPVDWIRDDAVYFLTVRDSGLRPHLSPDDVARIWSVEMLGAVAEKGLFQLTLHPDIIGHRSRIKILDQVLAQALNAGAWFGTHAQVASQARQALTP